MNPLAQAVDDYIKLRRGLGFKLREHGDYLHKFVAFLEERGSSQITTRLALEFATPPTRCRLSRDIVKCCVSETDASSFEMLNNWLSSLLGLFFSVNETNAGNDLWDEFESL
jgi:hypothetical protein